MIVNDNDNIRRQRLRHHRPQASAQDSLLSLEVGDHHGDLHQTNSRHTDSGLKAPSAQGTSASLEARGCRQQSSLDVAGIRPSQCRSAALNNLARLLSEALAGTKNSARSSRRDPSPPGTAPEACDSLYAAQRRTAEQTVKLASIQGNMNSTRMHSFVSAECVG